MTKSAIAPLRPVRLSDQIVERLRDHILASNLRPGDALPGEQELSRRFGVGRPTVREAMKELAGMGLVQVTNGRGPVVAALSGDAMGKMLSHGLAVRQITVSDTLQFRRFVEEDAVALAAVNRSEAELATLETALAGMRTHLGEPVAFAQSDIAFHRALARASGNALVALVIDGIAEAALVSSLGGLGGVRSKDQWDVVLATHEDIFNAVAERDGQAAVAAMRRHFDTAAGWLHAPSVLHDREQETDSGEAGHDRRN